MKARINKETALVFPTIAFWWGHEDQMEGYRFSFSIILFCFEFEFLFCKGNKKKGV